MNILIVRGPEDDDAALVSALRERGHTTAVVRSVEDAIGEASRACQLLIVAWSDSPSASRVLRELRSKGELYAIVTLTDPTDERIAASFLAGADDLLPYPFSQDDLLARVDCVDQIRGWTSKTLGGEDTIEQHDASTLQAWTLADRAIGHDLGELFGQRLEVRTVTKKKDRPLSIVTQIPIALADDGMEFHIHIGIDASSLENAGRILLGSEATTRGMLEDMMREIANVAGGAFVNTADAEGVSVSLGLPTIEDPNVASRRTAGTIQEFSLGLDGHDIELAIRIALEPRGLELVALAELREGMVVAQHVFTGDGRLFLTAGTRLTEASVASLRSLAEPPLELSVLAA